MKNILLVSTGIFLGIVVIGSIYGYTNTDTKQQLQSFAECYSQNAAGLFSGDQFVPYNFDLKDPKLKTFISSICNFYHEKSGRWVLMYDERYHEILNKYGQEFRDQYPKDQIPETLKHKWKK